MFYNLVSKSSNHAHTTRHRHTCMVICGSELKVLCIIDHHHTHTCRFVALKFCPKILDLLIFHYTFLFYQYTLPFYQYILISIFDEHFAHLSSESVSVRDPKISFIMSQRE